MAQFFPKISPIALFIHPYATKRELWHVLSHEIAHLCEYLLSLDKVYDEEIREQIAECVSALVFDRKARIYPCISDKHVSAARKILELFST